MKSKLEGIPRYDSRSTELPAALFNEIRLALIRLGQSLRFPIEGLRNLEIILDKETWIVVDASLNDIPVVAWVDFEDEHRSSLHQPMKCMVYSYHAHADIIIDKVLEALHEELDARLHQGPST
jgi:hypothetical protein